MVSDLKDPNQNMDSNSADQFLAKNHPFHTNAEDDLRQDGIPLEDADAWLAPDQSRATSSEPLFSLDTGELERVLVTSPEDAPLSDIPTWAGGGAPWDVSELRNQDLNQPSAADDSTPQVPERRSIFADDSTPATSTNNSSTSNTGSTDNENGATNEAKEATFKVNNQAGVTRPPMPNVPVFAPTTLETSTDLPANPAFVQVSNANTTRPPMPTPPALSKPAITAPELITPDPTTPEISTPADSAKDQPNVAEDDDDIPLGIDTAALSSPHTSAKEAPAPISAEKSVASEIPAPTKADTNADNSSVPVEEPDSLATKTIASATPDDEEHPTSKFDKLDLESNLTESSPAEDSPAESSPAVANNQDPSPDNKSTFTSDWGNSPENADELFDTNYQPRSRVAAHLWSLVFSILLIPFITCLFGSAVNLLNSKLLNASDINPLNVGLILGLGFIALLLQAIITTRSTLGTFLVGVGLVALYVSHNLTTVIADGLGQATNLIADTIGINLSATVQSGLNYCGLLGVFIVIMALCSHVSRRAGQRDYNSKTAK